jgi:hypothetical protein
VLLVALAGLSSCKQSKEDMISRKWQEIANENEERDKAVKAQLQLIDTMGRSTTPEQNMALYGVANADSLRPILKENLDSFLAMQKREVEQTQFEFKKNGVVYLINGDHRDSANWNFEKDGKLALDEKKLKGTGEKMLIDVLTLTKNELKLKFTNGQSSASATFKAVEK